jgi:hypothetical protein
MTVAELCKSIFVGDFTDIKEVGENNNPFVNFDLKYKHNANQFNSTILASKQHNSVYSERFGFSNRHLVLHHVGLEIKTKNKNPTYLALFLKSTV